MSDPNVLDQPWRIWASAAVVGILLTGVILGIVVLPIVQGQGAGLDPFTAICRAIGILPGSPAVPLPVNRAPPSPVSQVVWTPERLQVLARAETERGHAKVTEVCAACHGETGISQMPDAPNLAGQSGAAIYKQLDDYRSGSRSNPIMTEIARSLDQNVLADLAAYYAAQPMRRPNLATLAQAPASIMQLVELGDPHRAIPPCSSCHRQGSGGPIEAPILSEQRQDYLAAQLKAYASGERRNDVYARMQTIAAKLTSSEIDGLARYYAAGFR